jgi:rapamycin-insensitive companion of mTOR
MTPTQGNLFRHVRSMSIQGGETSHGLKDALHPPSREGKDSRSNSNSSATFGPRGSSLALNMPPPGSFSSDLKTATLPRPGTPRTDLSGLIGADGSRAENTMTSEQRQSDLRDKINKEIKIKIGSENLLEALISKNAKQTKDQRVRVESELSSSNRKLLELKSQLENEIDRANRPATPNRARVSGRFHGSPLRLPSTEERTSSQEPLDADLESESPTYVLGEILQALESEGMQPDYYVERANNLVELFKRYPALKYDLAWPIFGLRVQTMLLSESREVIAAGYRVTRHAIADRRSLRIIRRLNIDNLVIVSLVKESKASIEREQALKFVRAFLEVKDGVRELSNAVVRTVVSVAEHHDDRLRNMSILTISEILIREPSIVVMAGGIAPLTDGLISGSYQGFEGLAIPFLHLFDTPRQRTYLQSGHEMETVFTSFTDAVIVRGNEEKLKSSARLIAAILKTWPGVFALSARNFSVVRSLLLSLSYPVTLARDLILDLLFDVLQIKPPSWASSYLAGRRLTTYGRVSNLKTETFDHSIEPDLEEESDQMSLIDHFTTLLLSIFLHCGLIKVLFWSTLSFLKRKQQIAKLISGII